MRNQKPLLTKSSLERLYNTQDEGCAAWYFLEHLGHLVVAASHQALTVDLLDMIANLSIYKGSSQRMLGLKINYHMFDMTYLECFLGYNGNNVQPSESDLL
jgi:hypothetical protein